LFFVPRVGKEIALLQAEESACVLGLANVLFVRWVFISFSMLLRFHCMIANVGGMKSCRLRAISYQVTQKLKRATTLE